MLKRIITAVILIAAFLCVWRYFNSWLPVVFGIMTMVAAWEWSIFLPKRTWPWRSLYAAVVLAAGIFLYLSLVSAVLADKQSAIITLSIVAAWWVFVLVLLCLPRYVDTDLLTRPALRVVAGVFVLAPTWAVLWLLNKAHPPTLLLLFLIVWSADSGAYFAGRVFGKRKLAPTISPGKTWEGVMGGLLTAVLVAMVAAKIIYGEVTGGIIAVTIVTAVFSVVGDLFESKMKRLAGVKDSGNIFPGHGGVLDRIDALTAAAPVYALMAIVIL